MEPTAFIVSKPAICPGGDFCSSFKVAHCKHNLTDGPGKDGQDLEFLPYPAVYSTKLPKMTVKQVRTGHCVKQSCCYYYLIEPTYTKIKQHSTDFVHTGSSGGTDR